MAATHTAAANTIKVLNFKPAFATFHRLFMPLLRADAAGELRCRPVQYFSLYHAPGEIKDPLSRFPE
jgi:hypothetical protein